MEPICAVVMPAEVKNSAYLVVLGTSYTPAKAPDHGPEEEGTQSQEHWANDIRVHVQRRGEGSTKTFKSRRSAN